MRKKWKFITIALALNEDFLFRHLYREMSLENT